MLWRNRLLVPDDVNIIYTSCCHIKIAIDKSLDFKNPNDKPLALQWTITALLKFFAAIKDPSRTNHYLEALKTIHLYLNRRVMSHLLKATLSELTPAERILKELCEAINKEVLLGIEEKSMELLGRGLGQMRI